MVRCSFYETPTATRIARHYDGTMTVENRLVTVVTCQPIIQMWIECGSDRSCNSYTRLMQRGVQSTSPRKRRLGEGRVITKSECHGSRVLMVAPFSINISTRLAIAALNFITAYAI